MSDEVNYVVNWEDEATQCQNCASFQSHGGKNACVPENKTFEEALEKYGEVSPNGHCNFFEAK
ncbi:MAG: hypothetical protein KKH94_13805 [Candidatus Omnitrophica bacterium]|nr:hypothetical protein [Candidatus Omnitrophota bacterium]